MQQVDEIIQRAFVEAHLGVEGTHALKNIHAASIQSPANTDTFVTDCGSQTSSRPPLASVIVAHR